MPRTINALEIFLNEVVKRYNAGDSLVPFVGAGVSVSAGIPATAQLNEYLALCIAMALGLDGYTRKFIPRWHPKINPWPEIGGDWKARAQIAALNIRDWAVKDPKRESRECRALIRLAREAFGELSDWRLALLFLSRILPDSDLCFENERSRPIKLCDGDAHVIDSFFHHLTKDKTPGMPHRMLAHFAATLKTRVTLTLNFDDLLEQAYREAGLEPSIFEVHSAAGLPPWGLLGKGQAIVKMHGGKYGLRADLSLDREPTEHEKRQFRGYLLGHDWTDTLRAGSKRSSPRSTLLLMGISGRDRRVILLIQDALEHVPDLRVFWVCYSKDAQGEVESHFSKEVESRFARKARLHIFQHSFLGTLLWEIYQKLLRCIPSGGAVFPVGWRLPLVPEAEAAEHPDQAEEIKKWLQIADRDICCLTSEHMPAKEFGISAFAWKLFRKWSSDRHCLWLDGADLKSAQDVGVRLFEGACNLLGLEHETPPSSWMGQSFPDSTNQLCDELKALLSRSGKEWFLFLNLRTITADSADLFDRPAKEWKPDDFGRCAKLLENLRTEIPSLSIVCLAWDKQLPFSQQILKIPFASGNAKGDWAIKRVRQAMNEAPRDDMGPRLLLSLSLNSPVRHETALAARAILRKEKYEEVFGSISNAIRKWQQIKLLRLKPGHFLWMHPRIKRELQKRLEAKGSIYIDPSVRAELHSSLADWCMTFYFSTRDPLAAFQAVHHRCRAAELAADSNFPPTEAPLTRLRTSLSEACNHLEIAKASVLTAGNSLDTVRFLLGFKDRFFTLKENCLARKKERKRNREFFLSNGTKLLTFGIGYFRDIGNGEMVLRWCQELKDFLRPLPKNVDRFHGSTMIRLELAVLRISARDYPAAEAALIALLAPMCLTTVKKFKGVLSGGDDIEREILKWTENVNWGRSLVKRPCRFEARKFAFSALRRLIEVYLLQVELEELLVRCGLKTGDFRREQLLSHAQKAYRVARMLPRFIPEQEFSDLRTERSRLHSIFAGILACSNDNSGVQRHINEADIAINHLPESEEAIGKCVVDLRRIYCNLRKIDQHLGQTLPWLLNGCKRPAPRPPKIAKIIEIQSDLDQVELWLSRVEARIIRGRKSLWWWMTLRRYQIVSLLYREAHRFWERQHCTASDQSRASLAYASYSDTIRAEQLLIGVANRTMFDSFQLARILHAAWALARLLQHQKWPKEEGAGKAELESKWRRTLSLGLAQIENVEKSAKCLPSGFAPQASMVEYINFVRERIEAFVAP